MKDIGIVYTLKVSEKYLDTDGNKIDPGYFDMIKELFPGQPENMKIEGKAWDLYTGAVNGRQKFCAVLQSRETLIIGDVSNSIDIVKKTIETVSPLVGKNIKKINSDEFILCPEAYEYKYGDNAIIELEDLKFKIPSN